MAAFAGPRYRFTILPDYFVDYEQVAAQDPSGKATTQPNLGILDREYPEIEIPGTPWERLVTNVTRLNAESKGDVKYKVLFLTRHGLGYHNVQQAKVGTPDATGRGLTATAQSFGVTPLLSRRASTKPSN
ncbi:phosphoglycerate mutase family protein [Verticillium alfalfae VaMs.102]|uniref:Phosphoglycerate mutase family protein n=1 Tax=Verticillium alfalfae (strain VaMs.102 / ATCC MYA-4576 / FGSC 10136) TaxID=526221 RepID=C9SEL9_VERA1|nr:phosphoglycerate mutase family protein [Verticillium alfalfae VaMs.102]EEY16612.1 phosphoglycerate mutase family protein [Verticillium alfalfae VaMs.102]